MLENNDPQAQGQNADSISLAEAGMQHKDDRYSINLTSDELQELLSVVECGDIDRLKNLLLDSHTSDYDSTSNSDSDSSLVSKNDLNHVYDAPVHGTLLHIAVKKNWFEVARELIKHGADPNISEDTEQKYCPLHYATLEGHYQMVQILLDNKANPSKKDSSDETPLHKVVKRECKMEENERDYQECLNVLMIYKNKMDIDATDKLGNTALHYAAFHDDQSFVRQLLFNGAHWGIINESDTKALSYISPNVLEGIFNDCIKLEKSNISSKEFEVIIDYSILIPASDSFKTEAERLSHISSSPVHQHLLSHPIVKIFLELKWQKIRFVNYLRIFSFSVYLMLLTTYMIINHGTAIKSETLTSNSEENMNTTSNANLTQNYILLSENDDENIPKGIIYVYICCRLLKITLLFRSHWRFWIGKFSFWFKVCTCVMAIVYLECSRVQQYIAPWLILFSWTELFFILSSNPSFAVYVIMFIKVVCTFLKFFLGFSCLLLGFSFSFFLSFSGEEQFMTYPLSLMKTIVMVTGELEYTDISFTDYPISSPFIFIMFIFTIIFVFMNLLNGLAVSDISQIQKKAELITYKGQVEHISLIEPGHISLLDCMSIQQVENRFLRGCFGRFWHRSFRKYVVLLQNCLHYQQIRIYPHRTKGKQWEICDCHSYYIRKCHIDSVISLVYGDNQDVAENILGYTENLTKLKNNMVIVDNTMSSLQNHKSNMDAEIAKMEKEITMLKEHDNIYDETVTNMDKAMNMLKEHNINMEKGIMNLKEKVQEQMLCTTALTASRIHN